MKSNLTSLIDGSPRAYSELRSIPALVAALTAMGALASTAIAQEPVPFYRLGEIVVSARQPVSEAAAPVRVITAEEIAATGARTLDEAILLLPGMDVRVGGAGVPRLNYRGFRSRHLLVLLDGVPLNASFDGQPDPAVIPVEQIAFIKVTPPTGSILYGQGGLAGVINIVTRRGARELATEVVSELRQGPAPSVRASLGGGTDRLNAFVSGSVLRSDGYPSVDAPPSLAPGSVATRSNSDRERRNLFISLTADPTPGIDLGLTFSHTDGSYGIPPGLIDDRDDPFANRPTYERVEDLWVQSAQVAAGLTPAGPVSMRSWVFLNRGGEQKHRYDDDTYSGMDDPRVQGTYRQLSHTRLAGLGWQGTLATGGAGSLTLGLSAERDRWDVDLDIRDVRLGSGQQATYDVRAVHDERHLGRHGMVLEYELRPAHSLGLVAGFARHWMQGDSVRTMDGQAYGVGASYDPRPGTRLRASVARRFSFPTLRQLYDEGGGNLDLQTEHADVREIGAEQVLPRDGRLGITLFQTDARDYIERPERGVPFANHDHYRFRGLELTAEGRPLPGLLMRTGYTFMETEDRSPGAEREALQYRPRHRVTVEGSARVPLGVTATVSVLHVAGQVYYSRQEPVLQAALTDYTLTGVRLSRSIRNGPLEVYAGADNLFDVAYEEQYGFPQATRVLYGGISVRANPRVASR
jgi:vitamin B12 transporter